MSAATSRYACAHRRRQLPQQDPAARLQCGVEGHLVHVPGAPGQIGLDVADVAGPAPAGRVEVVDHDDAALDQRREPAGGQPVQRGAGTLGGVPGGGAGDDQLVAAGQRRRQERLLQARADVGDDDVPDVLQQPQGLDVLVLGQGAGDHGLRVAADHEQPGRRGRQLGQHAALGDRMPPVRGEVTDALPRHHRQSRGQRAPVRGRVQRDDLVPPQAGEHGPRHRDRGGLADAALDAEHDHSPAADQRHADLADQLPLARPATEPEAQRAHPRRRAFHDRRLVRRGRGRSRVRCAGLRRTNRAGLRRAGLRRAGLRRTGRSRVRRPRRPGLQPAGRSRLRPGDCAGAAGRDPTGRDPDGPDAGTPAGSPDGQTRGAPHPGGPAGTAGPDPGGTARADGTDTGAPSHDGVGAPVSVTC